MAAVGFRHPENPSTWTRGEPVALGTVGQQQTNYVTQSTEQFSVFVLKLQFFAPDIIRNTLLFNCLV
ncbi:hypothetical protein TNCV_480421 [Trichonephila clavipes]|nr:hypothetical protein TNCV_480421 [Trichonephila clavipes]